MMLNLDTLPQHPSPNSAARPAGLPLSLIVLHSTGGAFAGAVQELCNPNVDKSAHLVVGRDGRIVQLVPFTHIAWHAGTSVFQGRSVRNSVNAFSIGIEQEHLDGAQDWPQAQLDATVALCRALMARYQIPAANVVGHAEVALPPGRKVDPVHFPWGTIRQALIAAKPAGVTPHVRIDTAVIEGRIEDNTLWVPARALAEALGAECAWDAAKLELTLTKGG